MSRVLGGEEREGEEIEPFRLTLILLMPGIRRICHDGDDHRARENGERPDEFRFQTSAEIPSVK